MFPELLTHNWTMLRWSTTTTPTQARVQQMKYHGPAPTRFSRTTKQSWKLPSEIAPRERFNWGFMSCFATHSRHRLPSEVPWSQGQPSESLPINYSLHHPDFPLRSPQALKIASLGFWPAYWINDVSRVFSRIIWQFSGSPQVCHANF